MANKTFEFGLLVQLKGLAEFTAGLRSMEERIEGVNLAAKRGAGLREVSGNLAMVGAGALAASAAIALPLKAAVEGYEELQNHVARLGTALGNAPDKMKQLGQAEEFVKREAVATGYSMGDLTESLYQGLASFLNMAQAMAVSTQAAKIARATQGDLAATTNTLGTMMLNFSDPALTAAQNAQVLSDKLTAIQTQGKWTSITDLQAALQYAAPVTTAFGLNLNQSLGAISAWSAAGLPATETGNALVETMGQLNKAAGKLNFKVLTNPQGGVDLLATVEEIKQKFASMSRADFGKMMVEGFGLRAGPRIVDLIDKVDKFQKATEVAANSTGATNRAFGEFQKRGTLAFSQLKQALDVLGDDIGGALAPAIEGITRRLTAVAAAVEPFVAAHPLLLKFVADFAAIAAVALAALGSVALLGAGLTFIASYVPLALAFLNVFRLWALATKALTAAQWLLNVAMDANPVGLVIAGVALLGAAVYEMYQHWAAVKGWFKTWGLDVLGFIVGPFAMLPIEIYKHIDEIRNAAKGVAHAIASFFVGHSPIPEGPLHNLNLTREIARTLEPMPMMTAIRRVAMVTAMAAPMMVGTGGPAMAASTPGSGRGAGIMVNYSPNVTVHAAGGDEAATQRAVMSALRADRDELLKIIDTAIAKRRRTEF
jgi:TP901 family phage tail tape measure protein